MITQGVDKREKSNTQPLHFSYVFIVHRDIPNEQLVYRLSTGGLNKELLGKNTQMTCSITLNMNSYTYPDHHHHHPQREATGEKAI